MASDKNSGWSRKWSAFFALVIIFGGMAVSLGFAVRLRAALERNAEKRMIATSATLQNTVAAQLARYIDTVRSAAAGLTALPVPTRDGFTAITSAVVSQKLPAVSAVRFLVPAGPDDLGAVEPTWRPRGADNLKISPLTGAQQHFFTVFSRGLGEEKAPPLGVDQTAAPAEVEVTRLARTTGTVAISDAYVLLADADLPRAEQQLSFDVVAPVYSGGAHELAGYAALSIRGTEFLTTSLSAASGGLLDAELLTRASSGTLAQVATVAGRRREDVRRSQDFQAGERQWVLRTSADNRELLPTAGRTDMVVLLAGSVLSVMFGTLMYLQMSATARADREIELEVAERMAALPAAGAGPAPGGGHAEARNTAAGIAGFEDPPSNSAGQAATQTPDQTASKSPEDTPSKPPNDSTTNSPSDSATITPADSTTNTPDDNGGGSPDDNPSGSPDDNAGKSPGDSAGKSPVDSAGGTPVDSAGVAGEDAGRAAGAEAGTDDAGRVADGTDPADAGMVHWPS